MFDQIYKSVFPIWQDKQEKKFWSNVLNWLPLIVEGETFEKCDVFGFLINKIF